MIVDRLVLGCGISKHNSLSCVLRPSLCCACCFCPSSPRSSGGKVHLNLIPVGGGSPGSPAALRSYSPCTCISGAEAAGAVAAPPLSPRSAGARMACCGVLSGGAPRSYTSD